MQQVQLHNRVQRASQQENQVCLFWLISMLRMSFRYMTRGVLDSNLQPYKKGMCSIPSTTAVSAECTVAHPLHCGGTSNKADTS